MLQSTIKVTERLKNDLAREMNYPNEGYEAVIRRLLEDSREGDELTDAMKKSIEKGLCDIKDGKTHTSEQVKKRLLGL